MWKAIDTVYKGYKMRSRLEARWACYFDALGIDWEFEKEGFELDGERYLPDFWLPTVEMWAEVKPSPLTESEKRKCKMLAVETGYPCLMLVGVPAVKPYWAMQPDSGDRAYEVDGEICVGHVPEEVDYALSNYCDYPKAEHRFYASLGFDETDPSFIEMFNDIPAAVIAARSARFEHGERDVRL